MNYRFVIVGISYFTSRISGGRETDFLIKYEVVKTIWLFAGSNGSRNHSRNVYIISVHKLSFGLKGASSYVYVNILYFFVTVLNYGEKN